MLPVSEFIERYYGSWSETIDPFAYNSKLASFTNDLNPDSDAKLHLDAEEACKQWLGNGVSVTLGLFDPPYSPRQISELYNRIGLKAGVEETQNGRLYRRVRDAMDLLIAPGGYVLSFGWNTNGMGIKRGYELVEVLLVAHGGAHNDTICIAERKRGLI